MKLTKYFYILALLLPLLSCKENQETSTKLLVEGDWHLDLHINDEHTLPVTFSLNKLDTTYAIEFINAEEVIHVSDIEIKGKKITIKDPIFNSWFEGEIINAHKIKGFWYKESKEYKIAFTAEYGIKDRFIAPEKLNDHHENVSGKWEVDFSKGTPDHYKAIGYFEQVDNYVTGTFMTETGDYRYLEGNMYNNNLYLSTFDGSHAFLFKGALINGTLEGVFWSGNHWEEPWAAARNESFELTHPDSLTYLKDGYDGLAFTFPNIHGDSISLADDKFKNKVVIVNVMGPWCPNCKDETQYLTELYNKHNKDGLEVIALSFDKTDDFEKSKASIIRITEFYNAKYDFLIAGKANKIEAAAALPILNHIMSYPTSIFIDRNGKIRKIRTGFYGPGTGNYYTRYTEEIEMFLDKLLAEELVD
jgi:thiol-disulfide isomerase/thioredoxin